MIVTVANLKGGVGKTTSSVYLAHALAQSTGERCAVIDADPQASAAQWAKAAADAGRPLAVPVLAQPTTRLAKMVHGAPNLVIDTPPAYSDALDAAIRVADFVVVPTSSSAMDLSAIRTTVNAARRIGKPSAVLLTRTRRTRSVAGAVDTLRAEGIRVLETHIPLREALAMAFGQRVRQLHGYELATAELLGALPVRPYTVAAVRQRTVAVPAIRRRPLPPPVISLDEHRNQPATGPTGFDDDELVQRLKRSMARLATQQ